MAKPPQERFDETGDEPAILIGVVFAVVIVVAFIVGAAIASVPHHCG